MTIWLKQSTAVTIVLGPFVDSTDAVTAETGLTISQADVRLSKNGGAFAQKNNATSCSHMEIGHYSCPLSTTDTNTLGALRVAVAESGALPVWADFMVAPANVWDSLFGADKLDINVEEWNATAVPAEHTAGYPIATIKDGTGTGEIDTTSGRVIANVTYWNGSAVASPATAGYPAVTVKVGTGTGEINLSGGSMAVNATQIGGSAAAATAAGKAFQGIVYGTAVTGTLTTTGFTTNLTEATNDHYNGRVLTFITGPLAGQQTTIVDYTGATKLVTVAAMTEAPANGNEFSIA